MTHIIILTFHFTIAVKSRAVSVHPTSWTLTLELPFRCRSISVTSLNRFDKLFFYWSTWLSSQTMQACCEVLHKVPLPCKTVISKAKTSGGARRFMKELAFVPAEYRRRASWVLDRCSTAWRSQWIQAQSIQRPRENTFLLKKKSTREGCMFEEGWARTVEWKSGKTSWV